MTEFVVQYKSVQLILLDLEFVVSTKLCSLLAFHMFI